MAEQTQEQERQIDLAVGKWHDRQSKVDELEGELEELILMVEKERYEKMMACKQNCSVLAKPKTMFETLFLTLKYYKYLKH